MTTRFATFLKFCFGIKTLEQTFEFRFCFWDLVPGTALSPPCVVVDARRFVVAKNTHQIFVWEYQNLKNLEQTNREAQKL